MNQHIKTITDHLSACLNGEPIPAMNSHERAQVMAALSATAGDRLDVESLGVETLKLINNRLRAGLIAERELTLIQGEGGRLC